MGTRAGQTLDDVLYAPLGVNKTGMLKVSEVHTVYWEESGNSGGLPVMVLHGGPGGGSQADYRRYFDPAAYRNLSVVFIQDCLQDYYRIVQMDQRGCGESRPHAELEDNNTQALVADIEKLRQAD